MGTATVTKKDFKQTFLNFLDRGYLQNKYLTNLQEQKDVSFDELADLLDILEWVSGAFQYNRTPEGVKYWYGIQKEWEEKFYAIIDELEANHIDYDEDVRDSIW